MNLIIIFNSHVIVTSFWIILGLFSSFIHVHSWYTYRNSNGKFETQLLDRKPLNRKKVQNQ